MRYLYLLCLMASSVLSAQTVDFVTGIEGPSGMTLSGSTLFFSQYNGGKISFTDIYDPNNTVVDLLTGLGQPYGVTIRDGYLYYVENAFDRISRLELGNVNAEPEEIVSQIVSPNAIITHEGFVYFCHFEGGVYRKSLKNLGADADTLLLGLSDPGGLIVIDNELYISEFGTGTVTKLDLDDLGGGRTTVLDGLFGPNHMAYANGTLYVGLFSQGRVVSLDLAGGATTPDILLDNIMEPTGLAIFDGGLYIGLFMDNKIIQLELPNSTAEPGDDLGLQLFPNPSTDWVQVKGWEGEAALFNSSGQHMCMVRIDTQQPISVSHLPPGQYWLVLDNGRSLRFLRQ